MRNKCGVESVPYVNMVVLTPNSQFTGIYLRRQSQWFRLLMSKKIKCDIKFVRALLTNFHIKQFGLKEDKAENLLGIEIMLIGRYGGHKWKTWPFGSWMHE